MKKVSLSTEALYSAQLKGCLRLKVQDLNASYSWWGKKDDFATHIRQFIIITLGGSSFFWCRHVKNYV